MGNKRFRTHRDKVSPLEDQLIFIIPNEKKSFNILHINAGFSIILNNNNMLQYCILLNVNFILYCMTNSQSINFYTIQNCIIMIHIYYYIYNCKYFLLYNSVFTIRRYSCITSLLIKRSK